MVASLIIRILARLMALGALTSSFILLIIANIGTPVFDQFHYQITHFDDGGKLTLGIWGACYTPASGAQQCTKTSVGYNFSPAGLPGYSANPGTANVNVVDKPLSESLIFVSLSLAATGLALLLVLLPIRIVTILCIGACFLAVGATLIAFILAIVCFSQAAARIGLLFNPNNSVHAEIGNCVWFLVTCLTLNAGGFIFMVAALSPSKKKEQPMKSYGDPVGRSEKVDGIDYGYRKPGSTRSRSTRPVYNAYDDDVENGHAVERSGSRRSRYSERSRDRRDSGEYDEDRRSARRSQSARRSRREVDEEEDDYSPDGRNFRPQDIDTKSLTHVLYAFANVEAESGTVVLSDKWADEEIHWESDSWNDSGTNLYGCFKQFALLKRRQPNLKLLLSLGGWSFSQNGCFRKAGTESTARQRFVASCLTLLEDYGLDGIDIDWEYPKTQEEAQGYVDLLRDLRHALDARAREKGEERYELTIAAPCGPEHSQVLKLREMDQYLDFFNLMAYDFAGSWSSISDHQANMFDKGQPNAVSVDRAIRYYVSEGVPPHKLVIGMPLYGRSFANTDGLGHPFSGIGEGSWEAGTLDYKALPRPGARVQSDPQLFASWSYDQGKREFVSYDTVENAEAKADHIVKTGLGGAMFWELSADHPQGHAQAMIPRVARRLGSLDSSQNHLKYPRSKWDNVRKGIL